MAERKDSLWLIGPRVRVEDDVWAPATDIFRTQYGWLVKVELAGVRPEDVEVKLSGRELTIQGVRKDTEVEEALECYQMEMSYSKFQRLLVLPQEVNPKRVEKELLNGLLILRLICEVRP
jgi:HSP20 family protein